MRFPSGALQKEVIRMKDWSDDQKSNLFGNAVRIMQKKGEVPEIFYALCNSGELSDFGYNEVLCEEYGIPYNSPDMHWWTLRAAVASWYYDEAA